MSVRPLRSGVPSIAIVAASPRFVGGQSVQATLLVDALRSDGHDVCFIPIDPEPPRWLRWTRRVPGLRTLVAQLLYWPALFGARRADVVHAFSASYWSFLLAPVPAMLMGRCLGCRVVLHYHSGEAGDHLARWGWLVHPWLRLADEIVVPSAYLRDVFAEHGYDVTVVPNLVDVSGYRFQERASVPPRLLSVRSLEVPYRVDAVIDAFAMVQAQHPNASLTIAGSGSQRAALEDLVSRNGLTAVEFVGAVDGVGMAALYQQAGVFVNAAEVDNQPVSILEAFATGLPVVSTAVGDVPRMLRGGECGRLVERASPDLLATAICDLLEDDGAVTLMTQRALAALDAHSWPVVRRAWQTVYAGGRTRHGRDMESLAE